MIRDVGLRSMFIHLRGHETDHYPAREHIRLEPDDARDRDCGPHTLLGGVDGRCNVGACGGLADGDLGGDELLHQLGRTAEVGDEIAILAA
ncbi:hypothetical protein C8D88_11046 [Lentzea atacamensis]|uniref:Uncharacterized protein n=1 Tax=Lentzea atacamensis TaxID=531938 RepID=A0A316HTY4_9PSEU|nr:hypothetical protein [Lentzea atacamensis]PWK83590.1 hypothetical protein C8D88_11046 [Lentzea atacamensis]